MSSVNDVLWQQLTEAEKASLLAAHAARNPGATATPLIVESFADLVSQDFPPQRFLVDGLIPAGQLVMLGGRGKAGKSWLILQLIAAVDRGQPFLGRATQHGRVLYLALEDGQRPRIMKWQPSPRVDIGFKVDKFDSGGQGLAHIRDAIAAASYDLVVIDTLVKTLSGSADENNNTEMGAICNDLADMAHDSGACILIVHHTSKQTVENPFDALRGASAIRDAYDVGMMLVRKHGEKEATLYTEARDFDVQDVTIRQVEGGAGWEYVGDAAAGVAIRAGRVGVQDLKTAGDGSTADDIAAAVGKTPSAVRQSMKTAVDRGYVSVTRRQVEGSKQWVDHYYLTLDGISQ
jgi:hypothetical protein